jgi:CBS domain-containing protein
VLDTKITKTQELVYEMKVNHVMTKGVITVRPQTPMSELREIFRRNRISGTPVVADDHLVGIISLEDFIKWLSDNGDDSTIASRMTENVQTLYPDEPLVCAVAKFEQCGFGRFPVTDRLTGKLMGVITKGDIVGGLLKKLEIEYQEEEIHRYRASHVLNDYVADRTTLVFEYDVTGHDFKRGGENSSHLKRTLKRLGVDPDQITVDVKDSGPGIPDIEKALQPGFSTAPEWVRELGFGAGMGLNNIQKCADEMDIVSAPGKGTHLKISIMIGGEREAGRRS